MERVAALQRSRSGSFSSHSLARDDTTDVISEAEEIHEVKALLKKAEQMLLGGRLNEAVRCYTDALEIDEQNVEVIRSRASTFMSLKDYHSAYLDSEKLVSLNQGKAEAHYLRATTLEHLGNHQEATAAYLKTLALDMSNMAALTGHVIDLAGKLCDVGEEELDKLRELEPFRKLVEIGCLLYKSGYQALCAQVLAIASSIQTNQRGIQMKLLLTMGHAQAALKNHSEATQSYQDCYSLAAKNHDHHYQTKSLINLATLLLELHEPHGSIYYYELLLDLESELLSMVGELPNYWIPSLRCALRLNLSLAYKTIGDLNKAIYYAKMYLEHIGVEGPTEVTGESYFNIGNLCEILGYYDDSVKYYKEFVKQTKGDKRLAANAYGSLASASAHLHNWRLAQAYCEQRCEMAQSLGESTLKVAVLQFADLLLKRWSSECERYNDLSNGNHGNEVVTDAEQICNTPRSDNHLEKAKELYHNVIDLSKLDSRMRAKALLGLSRCFAAEKLYNYAVYHLDTALHLAESLRDESSSPEKGKRSLPAKESRSKSFTEIKTKSEKLTRSKTNVEREKTLPVKFELSEADFRLQNEITHELAFCLSWSLNKSELSKSVTYFENLITIYRENISKFEEENSQVPAEIPSKLEGAYRRLIVALVRLERWQDALCYLESSRDYDVRRCFDDVTITKPDVIIPKGMCDKVKYDNLLRIVNENDVTIVCYALIGQLLVTWVLKPLEGLVAMETNQYPGEDFGTKIQGALKKYNEQCFAKHAYAYCENRALPRRGREIQQSQMKNENLSVTGSALPSNNGKSDCESDPLEILYDLMISPVENHLEGKLLIIPDDILWVVPFPILTRDGVQLQTKVKVTMLPNFKLLAKTFDNDQNKVKTEDALAYERKFQCYGGIRRMLEKKPIELNNSASEKTIEKINPRMTSHPRLVHLNGRVLSAGDDVTVEMDDVTKDMNIVTSRMLLGDTLTTLTSKTWTGTDIVQSTGTVTKFRQLSSKERAVAIGAPNLPESLILHGSPWKPPLLASSLRELISVSNLLNTTSITGQNATRKAFLEEIKTATLLHVAAWMCTDHGYLAMAPDTDVPADDSETGGAPSGAPSNLGGAPGPWLVTCADIVETGCPAQLVVLSGGWSTRHERPDSELVLARAFIQAGAQCVLHVGWPVSDFTRENFFHDFYQACANGCLATDAFKKAVPRNEETCPFMLIGRDVTINLLWLESAMLDQLIDEKEAEVEKDEHYLNPDETKEEQTPSERLHDLQLLLVQLMKSHCKSREIIPALIELFDTTLKRIHGNEQSDNVLTLDDRIHDNDQKSGLELLKFLGFAFQAKQNSLAKPYVVFPHKDEYGLMVPVYDALRGILEIADSTHCLRAMLQFLPQPQHRISNFIDLLCVSKHVTPNVQLRLSDQIVHQLWSSNASRDLMTSLGYHQIGPLLGNCRNPDSRRLQHGALMLLLSMSASKDPSLMHKLDMEKLGNDMPSGDSVMSVRPLPTLQPTQVSTSAILMTSPWLSKFERPHEMREKMMLAKKKKRVDWHYRHDVNQIRTWHQDWLKNQAKETLDLVGVKPAKPKKVKVVSTSCQAAQRVPVDFKPPLTLEQIHDRRTYAHYILDKRLKSAEDGHRQKTKKVFLPYIRGSVA